jgi:RNA polymerase sigma factor (sigma-70 family)
VTVHEHEWLAKRFEENRTHLRAVAYRMLGSLNEADDAVQEAWLRLSRSDISGVENLGGWLTTVVARVSLDLLRSRASRREESLSAHVPEPVANSEHGADPEQEALLADSVDLAVLVVLDRLNPAERVAFVLHDIFAVPFEEIARIVGRSPAAVRQLASRARRRVQGAATARYSDVAGQRDVVDAFLAAIRGDDFDALLALLDPDVVIRADHAAVPPGAPREVRGARNCARRALSYSEGVRFAAPLLINGRAGVVVAPKGRLSGVLSFTLKGGKITQIDVIDDPALLRQLDLSILDNRR